MKTLKYQPYYCSPTFDEPLFCYPESDMNGEIYHTGYRSFDFDLDFGKVIKAAEQRSFNIPNLELQFCVYGNSDNKIRHVDKMIYSSENKIILEADLSRPLGTYIKDCSLGVSTAINEIKWGKYKCSIFQDGSGSIIKYPDTPREKKYVGLYDPHHIWNNGRVKADDGSEMDISNLFKKIKLLLDRLYQEILKVPITVVNVNLFKVPKIECDLSLYMALDDFLYLGVRNHKEKKYLLAPMLLALNNSETIYGGHIGFSFYATKEAAMKYSSKYQRIKGIMKIKLAYGNHIHVCRADVKKSPLIPLVQYDGGISEDLCYIIDREIETNEVVVIQEV